MLQYFMFNFNWNHKCLNGASDAFWFCGLIWVNFNTSTSPGINFFYISVMYRTGYQYDRLCYLTKDKKQVCDHQYAHNICWLKWIIEYH